MKKQISLWVLCLLVATLFLLPQAATAQCTAPPSALTSLLGTYAFNVAGVFGPQILPKFLGGGFGTYPGGEGVLAGTLVANGDGTATTQQTVYAFPLFPSALVPASTLPGTGTGLMPGPQPQEPVYIGPTEKASYQVNCDGTARFFLHDPFIGFYEYEVVLVKGASGVAGGFYLVASNTQSLETFFLDNPNVPADVEYFGPNFSGAGVKI